MLSIIPVVICGGSGTRLWPLSRKLHPKQFLALLNEDTLLQNTLKRLESLINHPPIIVCHEDHRFMVAEQLRESKIDAAAIILEPYSRNTAPAIALAALFAKQKYQDAILLVLPSDHYIGDSNTLVQAIYMAESLARASYLVTFGVKPTKPETGYGYIKTSGRIGEDGGYKIHQFVEKPDLTTAKRFYDSGDYYWNSGMFMFQASMYLDELNNHAPDIAENCDKAIEGATKDLDFIRPSAVHFSKCNNISIDYAIMEKTMLGALVSLEAQWSDIGSWDRLWEVSPKTDEACNVIKGDVIVHKVKNSFIYASSRMVSAIGVENCIIIATNDVVLVVNRDHCQDISKVIENLKTNKRPELEAHQKVFRPWGSYELLTSEKQFQVKRLIVNPSASLSLQRHQHRSEHWVIVKGFAKVTRENQIITLSENESTYIPIGMKHRLENPGDDPLEVIEVQLGSYLGEDDIVRFDDVYKR